MKQEYDNESLLDKNSLSKGKLSEKSLEDRLWLDSTLSRFDDILRINYDKSVEVFADIVIAEACTITEAISGSFFIVDEDQALVRAVAGFGTTVETMARREFRIGEGIIGQCVKSKTMRLLTDIPPQNVVIKSSLGNLSADSVVVIPLIFNERVYGVIEVVSLKRFPSKYLDFLERLCRNIASTLQSIQANARMRKLLLELQEQTQKQASQEEELRQNLEELEATQEELQRQKLQVEQQSALHTTVFKYAPLLFITTDSKGIITGFNPAAEALLGYEADELIGKQTPALFHDMDEVAAYQVVLSKELGYEVPMGFDVFVEKSKKSLVNRREWTYIAKNGQRYIVELTINAIFNRKGEIEGYFGVAQDVTQRKRNQEELEAQKAAMVRTIEELEAAGEQMRRQQEALFEINEQINRERVHFENIVSNVNGMVYTFELDPKTGEMGFPYVSSKCKDLFGLTPEELKGLGTIGIGIHPDDQERFRQSIAASAQNMSPYKIQIRLKAASGAYEWFRAESNPTFTERDTILWYGYMQNIQEELEREKVFQQNEELRALEEELRQNLEELQASQDLIEKQNQELISRQSQLQTFLDAATDHFLAVDKDFKIIIANDALRQMYRKKGIEIIIEDTHIYDLLPETEWQSHYKPLYERAFKGERVSFVSELEGEHFSFTYAPLRNTPKSKPYAVAVASKNITQAVQEIEQSKRGKK
jgi:PAS domain S-box-containing protein